MGGRSPRPRGTWGEAGDPSADVREQLREGQVELVGCPNLKLNSWNMFDLLNQYLLFDASR